jgi:hypothetical protein
MVGVSFFERAPHPWDPSANLSHSPVKDTHEDGSNMSLAEFLSIEYVSAIINT